MDHSVRDWLAEIGRRGGKKSRRTLAPETARAMVKVREARRASRRFQELRRVAAAIGRPTSCRLLILFGSAARTGAPAPQDLDLAALAEGKLDTVELTNQFIRALGVQAIDVADLRHADPLLMMMVVRDGVLLYERSSGEFDRFASLAVRRYADTRKFRAMEAQEIRDFVAVGQGQS